MIAALRDRLSIGTDQADSSNLRFRKRLLVGIALFILPVAFLLGQSVLGYWRGGRRAHAVGVSLRIDPQPRRLRPEPELRLPTDGAVPSDPHRARARDHHARWPRRLELGDAVVAPCAARRGRFRPSQARLAVVRGLRRHPRARARSLRSRTAGRRQLARRFRPDLRRPQHRRDYRSWR
jgi:hypothetical protein